MSLKNNPLLQQLKSQLEESNPKKTAKPTAPNKQGKPKVKTGQAAHSKKRSSLPIRRAFKSFKPAVSYNPETSLFTFYKEVLNHLGLVSNDPSLPEDDLQLLAQNDQAREDLTHLEFFTLDSASSQDLDDALYIEARDDGWLLKIALADPAAYLAQGSVLDIEAKLRASSFYLPGQVIHLLPTEISSGLASLLPGQRRPALVLSLAIAATGAVEKTDFCLAWVQSKAKLDYKNVAAWLEEEGSWQPSAQLASSLTQLAKLTKARKAFRLEHQLVNPNQQDFRFYVNDLGQLQDLKVEEKNLAHELVEEAMLLANQQAAEFLATQVKAGVFTSYPGFKPKELDKVEELLSQADLGDLDLTSITSLEGFIALQRKLEELNNPWLVTRLKRLQENLSLSLTPQLHLGLGVQGYASITAPLRRYVDLINLRLIKAHLTNESLKLPSSLEIEELNNLRIKQRRAENLIKNQLYTLYMANKLGQEFTGKIYNLNKGGLRVSLVENGATAFLPLSFLPPKGAYKASNPDEGWVEVNDETLYKLGEELKVTLHEVREDQANLIVKPATN